MNISSSRPGGTAISIRAGRDVLEDVGTLSFTPASLVDGLALLLLPPITPSLGTPSSASSPFPYLYRVIGMVMMAFVGVATFDKSGTGATSILQAVIFSKPEAPAEERHTGSILLLLRFLRSCAWCGCRCTRLSDSDDDLQDSQPHRFLSLSIVGNGLSKSSVMPL